MKYRVWLDEWLTTCIKPFLKERTIIKYVNLVDKKILPVLGEYELEELNAKTLQHFIISFSNDLSASTINSILSVLRGSLKSAVQFGIIDKECTKLINSPHIEEKPVMCFNRDEQKRIENYVISSKKNKLIGILICLYTGIRIGELFALTWDDIIFEKNIMNINKSCHDSWSKEGYHKVIEKPKTKSSQRIIYLPKQLIPFLKKLKKTSTNNYIIYGNNKPISIRSYQRTFSNILLKLNIPHKGFHALRHTFATRAHECGMNIKTLSEVMGHKNPIITMNRYAHSMIDYQVFIMDKLGKLLQ